MNQPQSPIQIDVTCQFMNVVILLWIFCCAYISILYITLSNSITITTAKGENSRVYLAIDRSFPFG